MGPGFAINGSFTEEDDLLVAVGSLAEEDGLLAATGPLAEVDGPFGS